MRLTVDLDDPTPPYEQLRRQVADLVGSGVLRPGERLPAVRQLAGDLGLATGTVARAYRELEGSGLLTTRRGAGTRVAPSVTESAVRPDVARAERLAEMTQGYVARARALGSTAEEIRAAVADLTSPDDSGAGA